MHIHSRHSLRMWSGRVDDVSTARCSVHKLDWCCCAVVFLQQMQPVVRCSPFMHSEKWVLRSPSFSLELFLLCRVRHPSARKRLQHRLKLFMSDGCRNYWISRVSDLGSPCDRVSETIGTQGVHARCGMNVIKTTATGCKMYVNEEQSSSGGEAFTQTRRNNKFNSITFNETLFKFKSKL